MKVYVDTNILIDLICSREPFLKPAQSLFYQGCIGNCTLIMSALSFVNTMYIGRKYKFSPVELAEKLNGVAQIARIVDLKAYTVQWALSCDWNDYEDATQFKSAALESADCIVTRNKKDFSLSSLPVYSVEELLDRI